MTSTPTVPPASYLEDIGLAMGRIASGVYIMTALNHKKEKLGMMASWVMQAGFDPPVISVAIHPDRDIYKAIQETGRFTLNVVGTDSNALMKAFAKYSPDQFDQVAYQETAYGVILNDAVSTMQCKLLSVAPAADHHLLIAEVVGGMPLNPNLAPFVHIRKSGFHY